MTERKDDVRKDRRCHKRRTTMRERTGDGLVCPADVMMLLGYFGLLGGMR